MAVMLMLFQKGGPLMFALLACSLAGLTVIFERLFFWLRNRKFNDAARVKKVLALCEQEDWRAALALLEDRDSYLLRVLQAGIRSPPSAAGRAMQAVAEGELERMRRYMGVLDTIITAAPLLGILGTVTGIISSFEMLGSAGLDHPELVTAGIAQALITTAAGLTIAIVALFPFNHFNTCIERACLRMETVGTRLEMLRERSDIG
jgi:biopolymer transport protein ExbB